MPGARIYSQRLGAIRDAQFEAALARLKLGRFVDAQPVMTGLFGQNVFVTTSQGEFVLRGAPHWVKGRGEDASRREDRWQFTKEVFFARQLHARTKAPVPWPMLHDETSDIFGWPYIVMPRMPGTCYEERGIVAALPAEDRRGVAAALGRMLGEMQTLAWPFAGDFAPDVELRSYPDGFTAHVIGEMHDSMRATHARGSLDAPDVAWIEKAEALALAVDGVRRPNTFVHGDYKLNNLSVLKDRQGWRISGVFDLHEARFGDGAIDVARQTCGYLDSDAAQARVYFDNYRASVPADPTLGERLPLYVVNDRMKFWDYFTQPEVNAAWTQGKTFRGWAQRYMDGVLALL